MGDKIKNKTYWPHMIVGFLFLALTLGYWTVKSASSMPVQQDNSYMMSYQEADKNINEIEASQKEFFSRYTIEILDTVLLTEEINPHSRVSQDGVIELKQGQNQFRYMVADKNGGIAKDVNASFMLTRPHTQEDDEILEVSYIPNEGYVTSDITIQKAGRYLLVFRAQIGDTVGFLNTYAYIKPQE